MGDFQSFPSVFSFIIFCAAIRFTGSFDEEVSCNFTLTSDLRLITVSMKLQSSSIATYVQSKHALSVQPGFESRFNATWVPNRLTLILFNVTPADKGKYRCEVLTLEIASGSVQTWERIIQVSLLEKVSSSVYMSTTPTSAPKKVSPIVSTTPTSAPETESPSVFTTHTSAPAVSGTTTRVYCGQARELIFVIVLVSLLDSLL
ncbi:uncharacterized protein [Acropora muricata]|uniref:uncharacterized protein isoform X2 n=1 Tax=Acropora muricata TaxID=159855 RepID=UPI0034E5C8DA